MNLARLALLREGIYRFVGVGFSAPTAQLVGAAASTVPLLDDLGLFDYAFALPVVEAVDALAKSELSELDGAYAALFGAGVAGPACSPHVTTYLADSRTGGVARMQAGLRATYRRFGFDDSICDGDMVDHIATEMEVMARLCSDEARLRADDDDVATVLYQQREFFTAYLSPWITAFSKNIREVDRLHAYTALATALHAFVEHERDLLPLIATEVGQAS